MILKEEKKVYVFKEDIIKLFWRREYLMWDRMLINMDDKENFFVGGSWIRKDMRIEEFRKS